MIEKINMSEIKYRSENDKDEFTTGLLKLFRAHLSDYKCKLDMIKEGRKDE